MNLRYILILCFLSHTAGASIGNGDGVCDDINADIMFILDATTKTTNNFFYEMNRFMGHFIDHFREGIDQNRTRFAASSFSTETEICFNFTKPYSNSTKSRPSPDFMFPSCKDKFPVIKSLTNATKMIRSQRNTAEAIQKARNQIQRNAHPGVAKFAILATDGLPRECKNTLNEAQMLKVVDGVDMIVITTNQMSSTTELVSLASSPLHLIYLDETDFKSTLNHQLLDLLCKRHLQRRKRSPNCPDRSFPADYGRTCCALVWTMPDDPDGYYFTGMPPNDCYPEGVTILTVREVGSNTFYCSYPVQVTVHRCPTLPTYFPFGVRSCSGVEDNVYGSRCTFSCNSGFVLRGSSRATCEPRGNAYQWNNTFPSCHVNTPPNLNMCQVSVIDSQGQETRSGYTSTLTNCMNQRDEWMHTQPTLLTFQIKADLNYAPSRPHYVSDLKFGVIGAKVKVVKVSVTGNETLTLELSMNDQPLCIKQSSSTRPLVGNEMLDCHANNVTVSTNLVDGERLCVDVEAASGGFYDLLNDAGHFQEKVYFETVSRKKRVCFKYDDTKPNHCSDSTCSSALIEPLKLSNRLTRTSAIVVSVEGWSDPIPRGGSYASASNIQKYRLDIHHVNVGSLDLRVDEGSIKDYGREFNATSWNKYTISMVLPDENPRLYAIVLEVHDNAGNVRYARRLVMFDNSSTLELNESSILRVTTSDVRSNFKWQTDVTTNICVDWRHRFYNTEMRSNNFLKPVAVDMGREIYGHYDQTDGLLPISGTSNVQGVVKFELSWSGNEGNKFMLGEVVPVQTQTTCFFMNLTDGDTCSIVVQAFDIMNNTKKDSVHVNIDQSGPVVTIREMNGFSGQHGLLINDTTALSKAVLSVQTMDPHSGIRTLQWVLGVNGRQGNIDNGIIDVYRLEKKKNNCTRREHCYCPVVGPCELSEHKMKFAYHQEEFSMDNHGDIQTNQYYLNITSTNNAGLSSTKQLDIILSMTSYSTIIILDGLTLVLKDDENSGEENNAGIIVGAVLGTIIAILGCILLIFITCKRLTRRRLQKENSSLANLEENKDKKPNGISADNHAMDFNNAIYDKINPARNAQEETRVYSTFISCPSVKDDEIIYENIKGYSFNS